MYLPVEPALALRFGDHFFGELASGTELGAALRNARHKLNADHSQPFGPARRRAATASYCAFGGSRTTITFTT